MGYTFNKIVPCTVEAAEEKVRVQLAEEGFGVLTEIDVQATIRKKLGKEMPAYKILGACNPHFAYRALQAEPNIGTMLPCNVIIRTTDKGETEIAAVDPMASMQAVENPDLADIAGQVRDKLQQVIERV
ncbi:DUF302 domain-containing protein [Geothermobacter hydrogeniphilus]|uniref:DUF302 domain-containing protein n=1 Tax=Geothermobacter hydrogeniphilus TaxID=1969733 RepID=A0A1X0Y5Q9_9BACT|nr:DUF302 domain-containing protein [Geothermobacter hydrogeniphilus]ORJ60485.1 hypothetical protein B5V00_07945 [Geothermobacter hydrogeniphilus]